MHFHLTPEKIHSWCGQIAYERGEAYYHTGKVRITNLNSDIPFYEATVKGKSPFQVRIEIDQNGNVDAQCTCPSLDSYDKYCQHIAAVLLYIQERQPQNEGSATRSLVSAATHIAGTREVQLTDDLIGILAQNPHRPNSTRHILDSREVLDVVFTCRPYPLGNRKYLFGLECKVGAKRLCTVGKIRKFLDCIDRRVECELSKQFTYDPKLHRFQHKDDKVIRHLVEIYHNEEIYLEPSKLEEEMLLIPPLSWGTLLPLLADAPRVQIEHGDLRREGLHISDEPLPLHFELDQGLEDGYKLDIHGLEKIAVMELYSLVLYDGKLLKLAADDGKRLSDLKHMLEISGVRRIQIMPEKIESFMEKVIPSLMKLGSIHIAQSITDRIMQTPLKAKLYLDRVKDRLLAGLEFQYGDIVFNPIEENGEQRSHQRILMRDTDKEQKILELMEQSLFTKTEAGYIMHDEEAEYDFLYHIIPKLERFVAIYATSAVKIKILTGHASPQVTVNRTERPNWLEFRFEIDGIPESEIRNVLMALEEKRKYYRLPNGSLLPLESSEFREISRFMSEIGIPKGEVSGSEIRLPFYHGLHLMDSERKGNHIKLGKSLRQLLENLRNPDHLDFPVPENLVPILRDYQTYGFQWLKMLAHYGFGGILADDMGLGKTMQSIAFIVSVLPEIRSQELPAIVVTPASLMYHWRNELQKFAPEARVVIADGSKAERRMVSEDVSKVDVIITSYPLLRRDLSLYKEMKFHTILFDEAQSFKNHSTQTAKAVKQLQAHHRFALTGTPVENRLEELWSIFDVVFPKLFEGRKAFNELSKEKVAKRIRPFLLRRLKKDVLKELPDKIEVLQSSELQRDQKKLYMAYLAELKQETLKHLKSGFQKNRIKILAGLTRLRQLCCHPGLFVEGYAGSSAKLEQLLEILAECQEAGKRILIFSQFTEMLGLIRGELGHLGIPFFYLDGKTAAWERVDLCNRFNEGERDLFLISLKAGGTGLNLTGADTVILYDLWWNPAVEQQAADRAHRIGQKNVVQVIRLITKGTVEEKIYELQQRKKFLIDEVIQSGQQDLSALTEQEIREILMI